MKKILIIPLVVLVSLMIAGSGFLGGCKQPATTETTAVETTAAETTAAATTAAETTAAQTASTEKYTFKFWTINAEAGDEYQKFMLPLIKEFESQHPNITVEPTFVDSFEVNHKMILAIQAGDPPDLAHHSGESIGSYAKQGYYEDLNPYLDKWGERDKFFPVALESLTIDGRLLAMPWFVETRALLYRKDIFEKYGISAPPKTWDELRTVAKTIQAGLNKDKVKDAYAFFLLGNASDLRKNSEFMIMFWTTGGDIFKREGDKWVQGFTLDQATRLFDYYHNLIYVDKTVSPNTGSLGAAEQDGNYRTGLDMMSQIGRWMPLYKDSPEVIKIINELTGIAPIPYDKVPANIYEPHMFAIPSGSKHKDDAFELLKLMVGFEAMLNLGVNDNIGITSRKDVAEDPAYNSKEWDKWFIQYTVPDARPWPPLPWVEIFDKAITPVWQEVLFNKITSAEAAEKLQANIQAMLPELNK